MFKQWLKKWMTRTSAPRRPITRAPRLGMEHLEDRTVPTHFRYGTLSAESVSGVGGNPANTYEFHMQDVWRLTYPWQRVAPAASSFPNVTTGPTVPLPPATSLPQVGDILSGAGTLTFSNLSPAQGSAAVYLRVLSVDRATESFTAEAVRDTGVGLSTSLARYSEGLVRTYNANTAVANLVTFESSARLSTLSGGNADQTYRLQTKITPNVNNSSPVSSFSAIQQVNDEAVNGFQLTALDPNQDAIRYRLSTSAESGLVQIAPPGLTLSSTGFITWNTTGAAVPANSLWAIQVMVEDLDSGGNVKSQTPLDFLLQVTGPAGTNTPPVLSVSPASTFSLVAGQSVNFTVTAQDPDATGFITNLRATNPPPGMTFVPTTFTAGNPVSLQVSWTTPPIVATNQVVTFEATDNTGTIRSTQVTITTTAVNRPPTANAGGPYTIAEGDSLALSAAASSDPDTGDTLSYVWDVNGDGVFNDAVGATPTLTWANLQALGINDGLSTRTVKVRVSDGKAAPVDSAGATLTVQNTAPTLAINGPSAVNEGALYTLALSATDPGLDTIQHWTINWGDGPAETVPGNPSTATHVYADGPNLYTIKATATDEDGTFTTNSVGVAVNVDNVPPTLTISGSGTTLEGDLYTLTLAVNDPGVDTISGWDISWGDGPAEHVTGSPPSVTHTYADGPRTFLVTATATDEDGGPYSSNSIAVAVNDVAPALTAAGAPATTEGDTYTLSLNATDAGTDAVFLWTVTWGDGSLPETVLGNSVVATHVYADGDDDPVITATATNDDGTFSAHPVPVHVENAPRTVTVTGEPDVVEGSLYTITLGSSDPGADTVTKWTVLWGDFTMTEYPGTATTATHVYTDNHDHHYEVKVLATDEDGTWGPGAIEVDVENVAPEATISNNGPVTYGNAFTVSLSDPTDPSTDDTAAGLRYAFALDADALASATYQNSGTDPFASFAESAGEYTVYARIIDKDGGFTQYSTLVTVNKADATISVSGYTGTYDGAAHGATGTATGVGGVALGGLSLGGSFTNAPGGTATWTFTDVTGNYKNATGTAAVVINKANASITVNGYGVVYDGGAHGLGGTATGVGGADLSGALTFGPGVASVPGGAITWSFDAGGNYNTATGSATVTVTPATLTVTANSYSKAFGDANPAMTPTVTGVVAGDGITYADATPATQFSDAGSYAVAATASDPNNKLSNYTVSNTPGTLTINKANATVVVTGYAGVYDGTPHGATGSVTGVAGDPSAAGSSLNLGASFTDAPGGTAIWSFTGGVNYNDQTGTAAIVITKANASITVSGHTGVYDGAAHGATGTATGINGESLSGLDLGASFTNAPGGTAHWAFTDVTGNYNDASGSVDIVIAKASSTTVVTIHGGPFTYTGAAQTPATVSVTGAGGLSLAPAAGYTDNVNAGTATASYSYAGDANHEASSGSATFAIAKAGSTTVATGGSFTYDGTAHAGGSAVVTGAGAVTGGAVLSYSGDRVNAGSYTVTATYAGDDNHTGSSDSATISITKAASVTTTVGAGPFTYDGTTHAGGAGTVAGAGVVTGAATVTYSANPDGTGAADRVNAGTYYVTAHYAGGPNHTPSDGAAVAVVITKANASVVANGKSKTYGDANPALDATVTGTVNGEVLNYSLSTAAGPFSNVGDYAIAVTLGANPNYAVTPAGGNLRVNAKAISYQIGSVTHVYGSPINLAAALGATFATGVNGETLGIAYSSPGSTAAAGVGTYAITGVASTGTGLLSNYAVALASGALVVTQATLTGDATTQDALNMAKQGKLTITVSNVSGLKNGDTLATFLSTAEYYITVGANNYVFVPTTVTAAGSSITVAYTLKDSALVTQLAAELADNTSAATAVNAGFYMKSANYTFDDDYLTRLFSTAH